MMHRRNLRTYYSDALDGALDEKRRRRFWDVLARHPDLRRDYELFVKTHELVRAAPREAADPDFEKEVLARLAGPGREGTGRFLAVRPAVRGSLAAAVLLMAAATLWLTRPWARTGSPGGAPIGPVPAVQEARAPVLEDPSVKRQIEEIAALIAKINRLNQQARRSQREYLLGVYRDQELVFRPSPYYQFASQPIQRDLSPGNAGSHAH
ncbi:MAG: anti-sigma factor family protein [Acidobacteriota bacterium]